MRKQILFVDDEPYFLAAIQRMMRPQHREWRLHFAENVPDALDIVADYPIDVVVSDITMPGKNGFDLVESLRNNTNTALLPIIMLTGNAESDMKRRALNIGATDLLNKPIDPEDLVARLQSVLRLKWYQDELAKSNQRLAEKVYQRTKELEHLRYDIIWRLAKAGEYRDEVTGEHVLRVAHCSKVLAQKLGLDSEMTKNIYYTSPLHDIGKIGVSDNILLKPGDLTAAERQEMERHTQIGSAILLEDPKGIELFSEEELSAAESDNVRCDNLRIIAAEIALTHHEKWDGTGYPFGLQGEEIPIAGQIVAITDIYDALRSKRPYKEPFGVEKSLKIMASLRHSTFSPEIFAAFERSHTAFEEIIHHYSA